MRVLNRDNQIIIPEVPTEAVGYLILPQVFGFGFDDLRFSTIKTFITLCSLDYTESYQDPEGNTRYRKKGFIEYSKESLMKMRGITRKDLNRDLSDLEELKLITQEKIQDKNGRDISTRIRFNYVGILFEQEKVNRKLEELGLSHRLGYTEFDFRSLLDEETINQYERIYKIDTPDVLKRSPEPGKIDPPNNYINELQISSSSTTTNSGMVNSTRDSSSFTNNPSTELTDLSEFAVDIKTSSNTPDPKKKPNGKIDVFSKIASGDYGKMNSTDLLEYFKAKYQQQYNLPYTIKVADLPKAKSMIDKTLLAKYGAQRALEIIDHMVSLYDKAGLATEVYKRPTHISLTQDWLIAKLLDHVNGERKVEEIRQTRQSYQQDELVYGPHEPIDLNILTMNHEIGLRELPRYTKKLMRYGYISKVFLDCIGSHERLVEIKYDIQEEVLRLWNKNNPQEPLV